MPVNVKIIMNVSTMQSIFYITNKIKIHFWAKIARNMKVYVELAITHLTQHR